MSGERVLGDVHGLPSPPLGRGGIIHRSAVSSVRAGARWSLSPEVLLEPYAAVYMDLMPVTFETEAGRSAASWGTGSVGVTVLGQFGANSRANSEE